MSRHGPTTRSRQKPARGCARAFATTFAPASATSGCRRCAATARTRRQSRSAWAATQYHAAAGFDGRGRTGLARRPQIRVSTWVERKKPAHEDRARSRIDWIDYLTSPSNNRAGRGRRRLRSQDGPTAQPERPSRGADRGDIHCRAQARAALAVTVRRRRAGRPHPRCDPLLLRRSRCPACGGPRRRCRALLRRT